MNQEEAVATIEKYIENLLPNVPDLIIRPKKEFILRQIPSDAHFGIETTISGLATCESSRDPERHRTAQFGSNGQISEVCVYYHGDPLRPITLIASPGEMRVSVVTDPGSNHSWVKKLFPRFPDTNFQNHLPSQQKTEGYTVDEVIHNDHLLLTVRPHHSLAPFYRFDLNF